MAYLAHLNKLKVFWTKSCKTIPICCARFESFLGRGLWHRVCLPSLQCNYGWPQLSAWNHRNRKLCIESSFKHVFWQAGLACLNISLKTVRIFISLKFGLEYSLNKTKFWPRKWPRKRTRTNVRIVAGRFSKQNHALQVQNLTLTRN